MTRRLYHLGRWCSCHGWQVLALWLLALALVNAANALLPPPPAKAFVLAGTNSAQAQRLLNQAFPGTAAPAAPLAVAREEGLADPAGAALLRDIATAVAEVPQVNRVVTPDDRPQLMSADGRTALLSITIDERTSRGNVARDIQDAAERVADGRAEVALGGFLGASISTVDTRRSEALGVGTALVILFAMLRRGWPVAVPLLTALLAVGIGIALVGLLERVTFVPEEATILGTMLGLGVGIDYALFLVSRHRSLLLRGYAVPDAAGRTTGTAGAAMVFAGGTLIAAVSGLALTGISFLMWLGFAAAIIVGIAVFGALTLVPALLGVLGPRVLPKSWLRLEAPEAEHHLDHGMWARVADSVTGRPWRYAIGTSLLLLLLALPVLTLRFGQTDGTALPPDSPGYRSTVLIAEGFGPGYNGSVVVVGKLHRAAAIPSDPDPEAVGDPRAAEPRIAEFTERLRAAAGVVDVTDPGISTDGGVAVWVLTPATGPADPATEELVDRLRGDVLPRAVAGRDMAAYVGGVTSSLLDLNERVAQRLLPFIVGVVALSFLLLMVAYRSLVIPVKAAAMNLISIGAAYGVVVAIFQWGWCASLVGIDGPVPIQSFVPMMMFAVLFGLSMDYEVFLLTAFREHWLRSGDMAVAVRRGLADTGQVITSAAAIMVVIFGSFVLTDSAVSKMFGVGLATAVLVDATLVRSMLVPALMVLAARWTWWLPGWLDRLIPALDVEGDPADLAGVDRPAPARPRATRSPVLAGTAALLGVYAGWLAAAAAAPAVPVVAIVGAALVGGLLAWLPRGLTGVGAVVPGRLAAVSAGILLAGAATALLAWAVPPVERTLPLFAAVAVLPSLALLGIGRPRRYGIPLVLGAACVALAIAEGWSDGWSPVPALPAIWLAAMVASLVALLVSAPLHGLAGEPPVPAAGPAVREPVS